MSQLRRRLMGLSTLEVSFERRGFHGDGGAVQQHLETVGLTFLHGYHHSLEECRPVPLQDRLDKVAPKFRGFAYEGAAMGLALLDALSLWGRNRLGRFLVGSGASHVYMMHVGTGFALARLPWLTRPILRQLDPLYWWLAVDGYGFHEAFFHTEDTVCHHMVPGRIRGYARRAFDQGLGRALWFVEGAHSDRLARTIDSFPGGRRADLWSGVGLASTYAGGVGRDALLRIRALSGPYLPAVAQGAAFAAEARERAGNPVLHTDLACHVFCGCSSREAAQVTQVVSGDLKSPGTPPHFPRDDGDEEPVYETWRARVQEALARKSRVA